MNHGEIRELFLSLYQKSYKVYGQDFWTNLHKHTLLEFKISEKTLSKVTVDYDIHGNITSVIYTEDAGGAKSSKEASIRYNSINNLEHVVNLVENKLRESIIFKEDDT